MKKLTELSYMRVMAMFMIVLFHSFCYYTGLWGDKECFIPEYRDISMFFCFLGLNTFVFISGYLYSYLMTKKGKYDDGVSFIINKAKRLLIPYFFWGILLVIGFHGSFQKIIFGVYHLWFLLMLFSIFLIATVTKKLWFNASLLKSFLMLISLFLFWILKDYILKLHFGDAYDGVVKYIPVFFFGVVIAKYDFVSKVRKFKYGVAINNSILILVLVVVLLKYIGVVNVGGIVYVSCLVLPLFLIITFNAILSNKNVPSVITNLDKNSMGIYILHHILIWVIIKSDYCCSILNWLNYSGPFVLCVACLTVSWGISDFINRYRISSYIFG